MSSTTACVATAVCWVLGSLLLSPRVHAQGQASDETGQAMEHVAPASEAASQTSVPRNTPWHVMQDGVVYVVLNHQGSPRGGDGLMVPNWWMGMASRKLPHGQLTFTGMLTLEPATIGRRGYREIFQVGEALDGRPLIDRQHPHDLFMQLAAAWRVSLTRSTGLTLIGAPVGEAALGPVAFMHRASAADNPIAPLSHHTFDSTHIAFGVITAALDHGPWMLEGSLFNGREPDQRRWDFVYGRLDSVSARMWLRPTPEWELQVSTGRLTAPEELEPGNLRRSTTSMSWTRKSGPDVRAFSAGYGRNDTDHGARSAVFAEGARRVGVGTLYARAETVQLETALLQTRLAGLSAPEATGRLLTMTVGGVRDVMRCVGFDGGVGVDVSVYRTPDELRSTYGRHPVSFHVFFRLRPPAGAMGRMWNMRMSQPMAGLMPSS